MFSKVIKKIRHKSLTSEELEQQELKVYNPGRHEVDNCLPKATTSSPEEISKQEFNYTYKISQKHTSVDNNNNSSINSGNNSRKSSTSSHHHKYKENKKYKSDLHKPLPNPEEPPTNVPVTCGFEDGIQTFSPQTHTSSIHFPHHKVLQKFKSLNESLVELPQDKIILQYYDSSVYKEDIDNLEVDEWLSDNNISFIYEYLKHTVMANILRKSPNIIQLIKPSIAYLLLHTQEIESLAAEMQPGLRNTQFLFLPINDNPDVSAIEGGTHWSLMVISILDRKALYYDSMYEGFVTSAAALMRTQMSRLLQVELELISVLTPQQLNGSDCGVIVVEITALLLKRLVHETGQINLECGPLPLAPHAGRTFILSRILLLSAKRSKELKI